MYNALITGVKEFIVLHKINKKFTHISKIADIAEKTEIEMQREEHIENACLSPSEWNDAFIVLKIEIIRKSTSKFAKFFNIKGANPSK